MRYRKSLSLVPLSRIAMLLFVRFACRFAHSSSKVICAINVFGSSKKYSVRFILALATLDIRPRPAVKRHDAVHPALRLGHISAPLLFCVAGARYSIRVSLPFFLVFALLVPTLSRFLGILYSTLLSLMFSYYFSLGTTTSM